MFNNGQCSTNDIDKLRAMHLVTGCKGSLWGDIADVLEQLAPGTVVQVTVTY